MSDRRPEPNAAFPSAAEPALGPAPAQARTLLHTRRVARPLVQQGEAIAHLLDRWHAGPALLAAGLLHAAVCQGALALQEVEAACGAQVAQLCSACVEQMMAPPPPTWRGRTEALRRVRFYTAAYHSAELALLSAAHMLQSAQNNTQSVAQAPGRAPNASLALHRNEAGPVLLPLFDFLGLRVARDELAAWLETNAGPRTPAPHAPADAALVEALLAPLAAALQSAVPAARVELRTLPFPGSDRREPQAGPDKVRSTETVWLEIVVPAGADCYLALHALHGLYHPIDGAVADSTALCRPNGHRSLQTAVVAKPGGRLVRVNAQIVTPEMQWVNRWGVVAFACPRAAAAAPAPLPDPAAPRSPYRKAWWASAAAHAAHLDAAPPSSVAGERIVAFSPQGEPFLFDTGSTVVDYAYSVHSDLAEQCQRFYVNGETVEPATVLRHLDLVELEHHPRAPGPTEAWLQAARTKRARTLIRRTLRRQSQGIGEGRRILEARLHTLEEYYGFHIPDHRVEDAISRGARQAGFRTGQEFLTAIAGGRVAVDRHLHPLFAEELVRRVDLGRGLRLRPHQLALAQCCKPRPGDEITGLPNRRNGVLTKLTIHRTNCPRLTLIPLAARQEVIALRWRLRSSDRILTQLEVTARDDDGLLGDALQVVYGHLPHIALLKTDASGRRGTARLRFSFEADCQDTVDEIADALRRLPGREVSAVRQLALPPSEQEALQADSTAASNPYSRMPVHDPTMFFGRAEELARINDWLRNNVSCIWLRGQKRVGKTSLLLHLRHRFWEPHEAVCAFVDFQNLSNLAQANVFYEVAAAVYQDLESDPRVAAVGPPDREAFASRPPTALNAYLRTLQLRMGTRRLVVLLDEFSRITDLYLQGLFSADFFTQWRSLLQTTSRFATMLTVVQQKTFDHMLEHMRTQADDPCWHVLELGETLPLKPFSPDDARRLVQWPMRNFMDFGDGVVQRILRLTGGSPFLIQAFCNKLVAHLGWQNSSAVNLADVETIAEQFMQPAESIFAHLLDLAPGLANHVLTQMALLAEEAAKEGAGGGSGDVSLTWERLHASLPEFAPDTLRRTLAQLCRHDLLNQPAPGSWQFTSTLFQRWLARNT